MRSSKKRQQKFYSCEYVEVELTDENGDFTGETKKTYVVTEHYATISPTAGTPEETKGGIIPEYDRYITVYNNKITLKEKQYLFVDREPEYSGEVILNEPDYIVAKVNGSKTNLVTVYGIKQVSPA